jgi:hypothetical protein
MHSLGRDGTKKAEIPEVLSSLGMALEVLGRVDGAGCRVRTRDPLITNQVLYQLS